MDSPIGSIVDNRGNDPRVFDSIHTLGARERTAIASRVIDGTHNDDRYRIAERDVQDLHISL